MQNSVENVDESPLAQFDEWEQLEQMVESRDVEAVEKYLKELPDNEEPRILGQLKQAEQIELLEVVNDEIAAQLLEALPEPQAGQLLSAIPPQRAAAILDELSSEEQTDLLGDLSDSQSEAILEEMEPVEAEHVRFLSQYNKHSAGGLMTTDLLSYDQSQTVEQVVNDLREHTEKYASYNVQYIYVTKEDSLLVGVLRLRDLLLASPQLKISKIMLQNPVSLLDSSLLQDFKFSFSAHAYLGLPVIDSTGHLIGVVQREAVEKAIDDQAGRTFLRFAGILGGEELRSLPLRIRSARRLSWLSINIVLNLIAASVIAFYQETLAKVIVLAVFLPIVSDMSGCSGNQSIAVSTRELVLGIIRPRDWFYIFRKEFTLGLVNGIALGVILGGVAYIWKGMPALGLVVGGALAANTLMSVCLGALIPLILKGMKLDPALASGPILTTFTDMSGFFLVLSFTQLMLPWLT